MNLGAFGCIFMMKRENIFYENINELSGLSKNHPFACIKFFNNSFFFSRHTSISRFFCKVLCFYGGNRKQHVYALAIVGLITTVVSAFYYLRIIKIIYFDKSKKTI